MKKLEKIVSNNRTNSELDDKKYRENSRTKSNNYNEVVEDVASFTLGSLFYDMISYLFD